MTSTSCGCSAVTVAGELMRRPRFLRPPEVILGETRESAYGAAHPLIDLHVLDRYKQAVFPPGYPPRVRTFYAPVDDVHGALVWMLSAAQKSLVVAMYGFDDEELAGVIKQKMADPNIFVQLTLDSSQAAGVHERNLLVAQGYPATSVAIGSSEHGRIMHMKEFIVDGVVLGTGSTNWSDAGERLQDNQLTIIADACVAAEARARIDTIHANIQRKNKG